MDVIMAEKAGYCYGVKHAMDTIEQLLHKKDKPIYTLGDISHNRQEMERLEKEGVIRLDSVEDAKGGYLIIRTHGTTKEEINRAVERGFDVIDATCPHVRHVQKRIQKYDALGYQIIIIGNKNHPEVIGACGWAENPPIVIESIEEAKKLGGYDRVCIVAQTTLIEDKFNEIVKELERNECDIKVFNTICTATGERQEAAADLAERVDGMIVVGGYHSSNTQKLKAICSAHCKNTWHIETAGELDLEAIRKLERVGVTAGASTPDWLIAEVTDRMEENKLDQVVETDAEQEVDSTNNVDVAETEAVVSEVDTPEAEQVIDETSSTVTEDASEEALQETEEQQAADTLEETTTAAIDSEEAQAESTLEGTEAVVQDSVEEAAQETDESLGEEETTEVGTEEPGKQEVELAEETAEAPEEAVEEVVETSQPEAEEVAEETTEEVSEPEATETVVEEASAPQEVQEEAAVEETSEPAEVQEETVVEETPPTPEENSALDAEFDFAAEIDNLKPVRKNSVVEGEVLSVSDDEVILNIGYKSDAVILRRDYTWKRDVNLTDIVNVGDTIKAIVTDLNDGDGRVKLSKIKYDNQQIQRRLGQAFEEEEILTGVVKSVSGSGLIVDVGFAEIFMPASQYHTRYVKDLESLVDKEVRGKIIDYNARRRRAILSQKVVLVEEREQRRKEQEALKAKRFDELELGDIVTGKIKTITNFGIFIDLEGIDGFVHRSDLTWERFNEPKNIVERGEMIEAKVIEKKEDEHKIKLSVKALKEKPWEIFMREYNEGDVIDVVITNTREFGAFAQIIPGVEGLIHISEISYDHVNDVDDVLTQGETVQAKILRINTDDEKISLSIKETLPVPEYIKRRRNRDERDYTGGKGGRRRRSNANREKQSYQESGEFTIGDSYGGIFDNFEFEENKEVPEEVTEEVVEETTTEE